MSNWDFVYFIFNVRNWGFKFVIIMVKFYDCFECGFVFLNIGSCVKYYGKMIYLNELLIN